MTEHNVVVHKANIALKAGESIREFTRALSDGGRQHIRKKLNLPDKGVDVFMMEAFSKSAVFEVFKFGPDVKQGQRMRFFATTYTRKDAGDFEFGPTTEVKRVTRFEPKPGAVPTTKAKTQLKTFGNDGQWVETTKSFWNNVL